IYEVGEHDGLPYLALEFVGGGSLAQRLNGTPQPPGPAARLVETLARTIHVAHERGIVHRDLKPANVLLTGGPDTPLAGCTPKITDFGLAKRLDATAGPTQTGDLMGTPSYMAPEQALGLARAAGPATDVYALGAILYELVTGRPPFRGSTPLETLEQVRTREPPPPSQLRPGCPRDLQTICLTCLRREPSRRYASAAALADDLRRFLNGEPIRARRATVRERAVRWGRRHPALTVLCLAALLAAVAVPLALVWHTMQLQPLLELADR